MVSRQGYDNALQSVREDIVTMGKFTEKAIKDAVQALSTQDLTLAQQVLNGDDIIDKMEIDIEDKCITLIARQQPLAKDLRILSTGLKITTDLERIGDHAYDIAKIAVRIGDEKLVKPLIDIPYMAEKASIMLHDALTAYMNLDVVLATKVREADDEIDMMWQQVFGELLAYMIEEPKCIKQCAQLIFVAHYIERIADHTTNIAEWVIYLVTGQRVRVKE